MSDNGVTIEADGITVDAAILAKAFAICEPTLREEMRAGRIESLYERGVAEDEGRIRLTFRRGAQVCRLVVEEGADAGAKAVDIKSGVELLSRSGGGRR